MTKPPVAVLTGRCSWLPWGDAEATCMVTGYAAWNDDGCNGSDVGTRELYGKYNDMCKTKTSERDCLRAEPFLGLCRKDPKDPPQWWTNQQ